MARALPVNVLPTLEVTCKWPSLNIQVAVRGPPPLILWDPLLVLGRQQIQQRHVIE